MEESWRDVAPETGGDKGDNVLLTGKPEAATVTLWHPPADGTTVLYHVSSYCCCLQAVSCLHSSDGSERDACIGPAALVEWACVFWWMCPRRSMRWDSLVFLFLCFQPREKQLYRSKSRTSVCSSCETAVFEISFSFAKKRGPTGVQHVMVACQG